jgi:Xaa-Pro aminopeptidase
MNEHLRRLREYLKQNGYQAYLAHHTTDIRWLTGFDHTFDEEAAHVMLVTPEAAYLHTDSRYLLAMQQFEQDEVALSNERLSHSKWVATRAAEAGLSQLLIEPDIPLNFYRRLQDAMPGVELVCDLGGEDKPPVDVVFELRRRKDAEELAWLKRAAAISDAAWVELLDWIKPGQTEQQVASRLVQLMQEHGSEGESFPAIVATGVNSAKVHARPGQTAIQTGDLLLFDFGAMYGDYHADISRTVCVGKASAEQKRLHAAVLAAHNAVKQQERAGMACSDVFNIAVESLKQEGLDEYFTHSLGHGVGLDIHELPNLAPKANDPLQVGDVVTDEPGVYVEGVGGVRIEDTGTIGDHGFESFATAPRELIEL